MKDMCLESLTEFRGIVAEGLAPPGIESVEYFKKLMRALGQKLGLPGAKLFSKKAQLPQFGDIGGKFDEKGDLKRFWTRYSSSEIISWITDEINNSSEVRDKCTEWLKNNILPRWKEEEFQLKAKAITEGVQRLKEQGKTQEEILEWLHEDEQDIWPNILPGKANDLTQEEFDKALKAGLEADKLGKFNTEISDDTSGSLKIKPEYVAKMLTGFGVLAPLRFAT